MDNLDDTLAGVAELYTASLREHGAAPQGVGWNDESSQALRFRKLAQVIRPSAPNEALSVNDLGCGYGAMFRFLVSQPSFSLARYYGYEISAEMRQAAVHAIADSRVEIIASQTVTNEADYSFASGTFNVKLAATDALWMDYVKEAILNLADKSRRGFAFNLMTSYVDWKQSNLFYADPLLFFDFCKRNVSRYVSLLHDYGLYEWTILVFQAGTAE